MTAVAALLAFAAAAFNALSAALQQRAAKQERPRPALDPRLLGRLLHRRMWVFSWVPDGAATILQALALGFGALALVQPILVSGLFLAIPMEAALNRSRPHAQDLIAVVIGVVGLAVFLATAQPRAGVPNPSTPAWIGVGLGAGALIAACLEIAGHSGHAARGAWLGVATGVLHGLIAALLKPLATTIITNPLGVVTDWHAYALIVVGIAEVQVNQSAFQSGRLAASLTALTLVEPVISVIIAVTAFHETLSIGEPRLVIEVAAAGAMAVGIWLAGARHRGDER